MSHILLCTGSLPSGIWATRALPLCLLTSPAIGHTNSLLLAPSGQGAHSRLEMQSSHLFSSPLDFTKHSQPYGRWSQAGALLPSLEFSWLVSMLTILLSQLLRRKGLFSNPTSIVSSPDSWSAPTQTFFLRHPCCSP